MQILGLTDPVPPLAAALTLAAAQRAVEADRFMHGALQGWLLVLQPAQKACSV